MKTPLPTLIFLDENLSIQFLPDILLKLAPKLKEMGYDTFYDEMPPTLKIEPMTGTQATIQIKP